MIPHTTIDLIVNKFGEILERSTKVRQVKLKRRLNEEGILPTKIEKIIAEYEFDECSTALLSLKSSYLREQYLK